MSFNFVKNLLKVKAEQTSEGLVNLAASLDKEGVAEAAIKQKQDEHNEYIKLLQEANESFRKERQEYDAEQELYNRYLNEAEVINGLLEKLKTAKETLTTNPSDQTAASVVAQLNEPELVSDLTALLTKVEQRAPILEKEKQEYIEAEKWMKEMQEAVEEISKELISLRETVNQAKRDIQSAEIEAERARKKAEQAEVIAGLRKGGNKFDTAINALQNAANKKKAEAEQYKIKADSLAKVPSNDVSSIVGKYSSTATESSAESLSERLARLKK